MSMCLYLSLCVCLCSTETTKRTNTKPGTKNYLLLEVPLKGWRCQDDVIIGKTFSKSSFFNILKCSRPLQTNKLVISLRKHGSNDGPVLSFATKY